MLFILANFANGYPLNDINANVFDEGIIIHIKDICLPAKDAVCLDYKERSWRGCTGELSSWTK